MLRYRENFLFIDIKYLFSELQPTIIVEASSGKHYYKFQG